MLQYFIYYITYFICKNYVTYFIREYGMFEFYRFIVNEFEVRERPNVIKPMHFSAY